jgi:hypothetical protein
MQIIMGCFNYVGYAMAQLVEALWYKPEGRGFDSRYENWDFSIDVILRPLYYPGVDRAPNRNE